MAADAQRLMLDAESATKGHGAIRNHAIVRLADEYGCTPTEIAVWVGIRQETVRNIIFRTKAKTR